jgi:hypothetical protein
MATISPSASTLPTLGSATNREQKNSNTKENMPSAQGSATNREQKNSKTKENMPSAQSTCPLAKVECLKFGCPNYFNGSKLLWQK